VGGFDENRPLPSLRSGLQRFGATDIFSGSPRNALAFRLGGQVAQSVEQKTENLRVGSSILPLPTISIIRNRGFS
jgi:hypothetical protein